MKSGTQEQYQRWTAARKRNLIELANKFGEATWTMIAKKLNYTLKTSYTGDACRQAYNYYA